MRVTGYRMIDLSKAASQKAQEQVSDSSQQVSSGLRVDKPSDDPAAWAAAQRAKLQQTLANGTSSAAGTSADRLQQTSGALTSLTSILSQVKSLVVQGANASYSADDRAKMSETVKGLMASAVAAANTQLDDGEYALGGSASTTAPFNADGSYNGDADAREISAGANASSVASIPGSRLTAADGVDVIPLLGKIATSLANNDTDALNTNLGDLNTAIQQVSLTQTVTGGAMSALNATVTAHTQLSTNLSKQISDDVEVDTVSAASDLAKASASLQANQAVTAKLISILSTQTQT
jgi:flagellar hook-associated protein 3 FlgL